MDTPDLVTKAVTPLIEPILDEMDFELVDIEYLSEHGRWVLRIFVDKEGGMTVADCARVSREVGDLIDVKDHIPHEYVLEVSSPGLNRPLKKEKDILWAIGRKVKVKMGRPLKGRRNFTGYLRSFQDSTLYLEVENNLVALPWGHVAKANLVYEFDN
jgi:ribosome maturation factor RimP